MSKQGVTDRARSWRRHAQLAASDVLCSAWSLAVDSSEEHLEERARLGNEVRLAPTGEGPAVELAMLSRVKYVYRNFTRLSDRSQSTE